MLHTVVGDVFIVLLCQSYLKLDLRHYAFSSRETAQSFLRHAAGRSKEGFT